MEMPEAGVFDVSTLSKMYNGNHTLVERTVRVFRETLPEDVQAMTDAWLTTVADNVHNQVHKMRPNARLLGATSLTYCLDLISRASHQGNAFELEMALSRIRSESEALQNSLREFLNAPPSAG